MTILEAMELWKKDQRKTPSDKRAREAFERYYQHEEPRPASSLFYMFRLPSNSEVTHPDVHDALREAIAATVKSTKNGKKNAVDSYRKFVDFLNCKCDANLSVDFPQVNISNSLERQIEIVKILQEGELHVDEVAERLWVDERTINEDLACLSVDVDGNHPIHDPIEVLGQRLNVNFKRSKGLLSFPSKMHPFFLTSNITQVIAMLEGLRMMTQRPGWQMYATMQAASIWAQISASGKSRIHEVSAFLEMDYDWYLGLEQATSNRMFNDEATCSYEEACGNLLNCMKNGMVCDVLYRDASGESVTLRDCQILDEREGVLV